MFKIHFTIRTEYFNFFGTYWTFYTIGVLYSICIFFLTANLKYIRVKHKFVSTKHRTQIQISSVHIFAYFRDLSNKMLLFVQFLYAYPHNVLQIDTICFVSKLIVDAYIYIYIRIYSFYLTQCFFLIKIRQHLMFHFYNTYENVVKKAILKTYFSFLCIF